MCPRSFLGGPFWVGALYFLIPSCGGGGSSSASGSFSLLSTNVPPAGIWPINKPIEFRFDQPVDILTASFSSIQAVAAPPSVVGGPEAGPVQGSLYAKPGSNDQTLVFQPLCPTDSGFQNGGLMPGNAFQGVIYTITVVGTDSGQTQVLRAKNGSKLKNSFSFTFQTPTGYPLFDPNPFGPPKPVEIENFPAVLPPNLLCAPNAPIDVILDQPVKASSINNNSLRMEFIHPLTQQITPIPAQVVLTENCAPSGNSILTIVPYSVLPFGQSINVVLSKDVEGFGESDRNSTDLLVFNPTVSEKLGDPQRDAILEDFSESSQLDSESPAIYPLASWGGGTFQAAPIYPGPESGVEIEIGTATANGPNVSFSTDGFTLKDKQGNPIFFSNGVIEVGKFTLLTPPPGKTTTFRATGSNPLIIRCSQSFTIQKGALLSVDGQSAPYYIGLGVPNFPVPGGEGRCGGGNGGDGSPLTDQSDPKGWDGNGSFNQPGLGGRGGHSGYSAGTRPPGGGGGGNLGSREFDLGSGQYVTFCYSPVPCATDCSNLLNSFCADPPCEGVDPNPCTIGEDGNVGFGLQKDAFTGMSPPLGGKAGDSFFVDGIDNNNFFGRKPIGNAVIQGELTTIFGGQGGGGGGDSINSGVFPSPNFMGTDGRGGSGGGGAGILIVQCMGTILINGTITATGGDGGNGELYNCGFLWGAGGGGGSGGYVSLESPTKLQFGFDSKVLLRGGNRGLGGETVDGAPSGYCNFVGCIDRVGCSGGNGLMDCTTAPIQAFACRHNCTAGRGGAGGKGISNLLVPFETSLSPCGGVNQPSIKPGALVVEINSAGAQQNILCERDPLLSAHFTSIPNVLIPTFGPHSAGRSGWYYTGWADIGGIVNFEFGGIDPGTGAVDSLYFQALASGAGADSFNVSSVTLNNQALADLIRSAPKSLIGDAFVPNPGGPALSVLNASVSGNLVTLSLDPSQGEITEISQWKVQRRFLATSSDGLPAPFSSSSTASLSFEGADESNPGSMIPNPATLVGPTTNISNLAGKKLIRFSAEFEANALQQTPLTKQLPLPGFKQLKIPYFIP